MDVRINQDPRDLLVEDSVCGCLKIFDGSSLDEKIAFEVSQKACGAGV